jgi:molybdopterin/thiamine biosynthesis adenylyltransferase
VNNDRFHRQELLFGREGQERLQNLHVALVGLGGLGSHVAQQLAYFGVRRYALIDRDQVGVSNMNRLIGATRDDAAAKRPKTEVTARLIKAIEPHAVAEPIEKSFISPEGFAALRSVDVVIGSVDRHGARFVLNELCAAYRRPYLDLATDINVEQGTFGGHILYARGQDGCAYCLGLLDENEVSADLATDAQREETERIYGIRRTALGGTGPAVVSVNGVVASLGVTELMREVTGMGTAKRHLEYRGQDGKVLVDTTAPPGECFYCSGLYGQGDAADLNRYLRMGLGEPL